MKITRPRDASGDTPAPYQKTPKPHIERRRRAKVTEHINQIRMLVPTGRNTLSSAGRLERAEILEQAVNHIQDDSTSSTGDADGGVQVAAGYMACLQEALQCLGDAEHAELRAKLSGYVADMLERRMATPPNDVIYLRHLQVPSPSDITRASDPRQFHSPSDSSLCISFDERDLSGVPQDVIRGGQWLEHRLISPEIPYHQLDSTSPNSNLSSSIEHDRLFENGVNVNHRSPTLSLAEGSYRTSSHPRSQPLTGACPLGSITGTSAATTRVALTPSPPLHPGSGAYRNSLPIAADTLGTMLSARGGYMTSQQVPPPATSWGWNPTTFPGQMYGYSY